jgi:proteasome lid subunit RPN8/RPN11
MYFVNVGQIWETYGNLSNNQSQIETCGYLTHQENLNDLRFCQNNHQPFINPTFPGELIPIVCGVAGNDGRPYCKYTEPYQPILWHTHPSLSKPYPSNEDIMKALKIRDNEDIIIDNLLICRWGIWEWHLSTEKKHEINQKKLFPFLSYYLEPIAKVAYKEWSEIEKSMDKELYKQQRIDLTPEIEKRIEITIQSLISKIEGFQIYFTSWKNIGNYPYYYLKIT